MMTISLLLLTLVFSANTVTGQTKEVCEGPDCCPMFTCVPPPPDCAYGEALIDEHGCATSCGTLDCPIEKPCPKDAKVCPDGSSVSRNMENGCDFDPCPVLDCQICPHGYFDGCNNCGCDETNSGRCTRALCKSLAEPRCNPAPVDEACPVESKVCPDGSSVSRNPENGCDFDLCPTVKMCATFACAAPQPGCSYDAPPVDKDGCATSCGTLICPIDEACPVDSKVCPDGSSVSRNPENGCDFDACPVLDCKTCPFGFFDGCNNCGCDPQFCTRAICKSLAEPRCNPPPDAKVCSKISKRCPDGSTVGPNPDNDCAFDPCPPVKVCTIRYSCARPPSGCSYDAPPVDKDGCATGCGTLNCPIDKACPADSKVCPDGSSVSRNPKNGCDFDACPLLNCQTCPHGYFDGCNNCGCGDAKSGTSAFCTLKFCKSLAEPRCNAPPAAKSCTKDMKACPDGSSVSRNPMNGCAFNACPSATVKPPTIMKVDCKSCPRGFSNGCNTCTCSTKGVATCTRSSCRAPGELKCKTALK